MRRSQSHVVVSQLHLAGPAFRAPTTAKIPAALVYSRPSQVDPWLERRLASQYH